MRRDNILLLLIVSFVFFNVFLLFPHVSSDLHFSFSDELRSQFTFPITWLTRGTAGLGQSSSAFLWNWPITFLFGFLGTMGVSHQISLKIFGFVPIILLGVFSLNKFFEKLNLSKYASLVGKVFYLTTTYLLLLVDGGQLSIGLAYAWFPASYFLFIKSIGGKFKDKTIAGLGLWILGLFDIRFIYILAILLVIRFLFERGEHTFDWVKTGLVTALIFSALNAYWFFPLIRFPLPNVTFSSLTKSSNLDFTQLKNSVSLLQPHWYLNVFGKIPPFRKEFLLISILAFLAPLLKRKDKRVWFWVIVALVSVFLTKGANPPFPQVYPWLFTHVPGFSLFRDSTKFFFLVALSYSVLIAFTVDEITKRFSRLKVIFPVFIIIYLLFLVRPVYLGQMTGTFSMPRYKNEYFSLAKKLEEDKNFGRIFWIPSKSPLGFASPTHPSVEASRLESLRPFAAATVGSFETQNFIREGNYMGELFDIAGIEYLVYPYFDPKRDDMSTEKVDYYNTFLNQIESLPWISKKISDIPISVFKTKENKGKFFLSQNTYFIVGSDRIYSDIKNLGAKFSDNALVFAEENSGPINQIEKIPQAKILLYDKNLTDLALSFVGIDNIISPSALLNFSPDKTGWWKREGVDLVWTRDFLQWKYGIDNLDFDYGQGWAIAEGGRELSITNTQFSKGKILYARIMQSSKGGEASFYQGDSLIGRIDTKVEKPEKVTIKLTGNSKVPDHFYEYDKADFHWVKVGELLKDGSLTIKTKGEINIVNSLAVISPDEENSLSLKIEELKNSDRVFDWDKLDIGKKQSLFAGENKAKVSYTVLAPTNYKVKIEGLKNPTTLFFSETYDDGWQMNSKEGYKLYSLINGFWVDHDGEYDLYFTPQKYVMPGLVISVLTLISCIMFLIWKKLERSS